MPCEMIIYVYIYAFIRSHESNQVALLITEGTGSSLWRFSRFWWLGMLSFGQLAVRPMR